MEIEIRHGGCDSNPTSAGVAVTPAPPTREGVMAAKKIQAKSKSKTAAKKGARKVAPTTPRGMARRQLYVPPSTD